MFQKPSLSSSPLSIGVSVFLAVLVIELVRGAEGSGRKDFVLLVSFGVGLLSYVLALPDRRDRKGRK